MADLYDEFGQLEAASYIRSITSGKIIVLSVSAAVKESSIKEHGNS